MGGWRGDEDHRYHKRRIDALSKQKRVDESFSGVINRLTKKTGNLADCYGAWDMDASEAEGLKKSLDTHWHKATQSLKKQTGK